jgi:DNA repair protein RecN (Recombination protein N)
VLHELHIAGLGVIEDLDLGLHPGLNVLTGETGAGKTMITVGLSLALGARATSGTVRDGARAAQVQARFDVPADVESAHEWEEDGEILLSRTVPVSGKGSARAGGQLVTASALSALGRNLVEVHGQHQAQRLLSPATQTAFLDRFAGSRHLAAVAAYRETFQELRAARSSLEELRRTARDRERELDLLAYQVREIEAVAPRAGESETLVAEEGRLAHVERLVEHAASAEAVMTGDDASVADALAGAARSLDEAGIMDPAAHELSERAHALSAEVLELGRDLRGYRETLVADPERLQLVRERVAALRGLQRKYGETDGDVIAFLGRSSAALADLSGADDRLEELEADEARLAGLVTERAAAVSGGRQGAAEELAVSLCDELQQLGMPDAGFQVALEPLDELGPTGAERVELRLAPGPGHEPRPIAAAASGGELSRVMLACRSVLADVDEVPTLVFDEVDAGIGGQAGLAVGRRLAALAGARQVLVVTHLPQIACFADRHIRVEKRDGTASVQVLGDDDRIAELSRMLAGMAESESAVSHAQELLEEAAKHRVAVAG